MKIRKKLLIYLIIILILLVLGTGLILSGREKIIFIVFVVSIYFSKILFQKIIKLKEDENKFRRLFEETSDAIMTLEPPNWRFTTGNLAVIKMFGAKNEEEFISKGPWDISPQKQPDGELSSVKAKKMIEKALLEGSNFFEWKHQKLNGKSFSSTVLLTRVEIKGKEILQATVRNITKQKNIEIELQNKKQKALDSAQAKSNFLANMSHEIRTPMNSILGFTDLLAKTKLDVKQEKYLKLVRSSGQLLIGIIDDILDISKLESGKITLESIDFRLDDLIHEVFGMIVTRMKNKPFDTYIDIDQEVPLNIKGDLIRLQQILVNLLGNAIKFTSKGSIGITVHLNQKEDLDTNEDISLLFIINDTGIGIPNDKLNTIFELFTQADSSTTRKFGGTGLGLAISKALTEAMGGKIWVESEIGKGSEFKFILNLKKGKSIHQESIDQTFKNKIKKKKIFIIDDNKISQKLIHKYCEKIGLQFFGEADSPESALQKLKKLKLNKNIVPDLILCDIMMDGMDGYDLVEKIKENSNYENTKFIAVTADLHAETSEKAASKVFDAFITKPIGLKEMAVVIFKVLEYEEKEEAKKEENDCKGINILVAEDVEANQMLIQVYFEDLGCKGSFANNGQEAIDMLKANNKYDLCLMDIQMPVMGGIEATKIIRKEISKTFPIIALTAAVMKEDREKAKQVEMTDFLTKPIDIKILKEKILQYGRKNITQKLNSSVDGTKVEKGELIENQTTVAQPLKILVVDDTLTNLELIKIYLEMFKWEGEYARNGKEAVEKIKNNNYDICLMDLQMPIMDGIEATKIIRSEVSKELPIIALTAAVEFNRKMCLDSGMNDYITKPINIDKLKKIITKNIKAKGI